MSDVAVAAGLPPVERYFPDFAAHVHDLTAQGVEFFLASNGSLRRHLNEVPYGYKLTWLDFTDIDQDISNINKFLDLFNVINGIAFGDRGIPMPQWVMVDLILMPSAAVIASLPQDAFAIMVENSTFSFDSDVKGHLRKVLDRARQDEYAGPMPVGGYCAAPSAALGTWVGWSLWSLMPNVGLGQAVKALALSAYRAHKLDGVTQYDNSALKVHTRFGALRVAVGSVPFHTSPGSFVYETDFTCPMRPDALDPSFLLDPFDLERQQEMQRSITDGRTEFYVLPPGHVDYDGRAYVPVLEVPR